MHRIRTTLAVAAALSLAACQSIAPAPPGPPIRPTPRAGGGPVAPVPLDDGDELVIHALDVGQGDCNLVLCPNGVWIMVDCGSTGNGDITATEQTVANLLDDEPVDTLVVTHADRDHYNWLANVLDGVAVNRVLLGGLGGSEDYPESFQDFLDDLEDEDGDATPLIDFVEDFHNDEGDPSDDFDCGDVDVYILAANVQARRSPTNAESIVLMFDYISDAESFRGILTGDATFDTEDAILEWYSDLFLDSTLLKVGHHGSSTTSSSPEWLEAVDPDFAFASAGQNTGFKHPRCSVIEAVEEYVDNVDDCHELDCGANAEPDDCPDWNPPWCWYESQQAVFNTYSNGDLTFTFDPDDGLSWDYTEGNCD